MDTIQKIKEIQPLIHSITNYVTINDVANMILAIGGKPIMAEEVSEVAEITKLSKGLNINMGMIHKEKLEAMINAGKSANQNQIPVVLDPVGCGATLFRKEALERLLHEVHFTVIKANASEMMTVAKRSHVTLGVDASDEDLLEIKNHLEYYKDLSAKLDTILVVTGKEDYVISHDQVYVVYNGHPMMSKVTGTGCCLNGLITTFVSVNQSVESVLEAVMTMGYAGEKAYALLKEDEGNSTYRNKIIDQVYLMTDEEIMNGGKYESR